MMNDFAHIAIHHVRIVSVIARIVRPHSHTVRPTLTDTNFCRSFVTMMPFSCDTMGQLVFSRKLFANGDPRSRTDIQVKQGSLSDVRLRIDI